MPFLYGNSLRLDLFGTSHGPEIGFTLEGIPKGEAIDETALLAFLERRAPGRGPLTTARRESDRPIFLSGLCDGKTTGEVIRAVIRNEDVRPQDYKEVCDIPRPGHADLPAVMKYGKEVDLRGGGRFSGRLTAPLATAGFLALSILNRRGIRILAHIDTLFGIEDRRLDRLEWQEEEEKCLQNAAFPTLSPEIGEEMMGAIAAASRSGDSVGGSMECVIYGLPIGLGEHPFASVESRISAAVFAIPSVKGIEFGAGFDVGNRYGSENNDPYFWKDGEIRTRSNHAGGILGGMTTGMPIVFRVAVKPTPSIAKEQESVSLSRHETAILTVKGRHDPCILPRAVPVLEATAAIAILDLLLDENKV